MNLSVDPKLGAISAPAADDDSFLKKVGQWAFSTTFTSTKHFVQELLGRFGVGPVDGPALAFLEECVAPPNCLPAGCAYDVTLEHLAAKYAGTPAGTVLANDLELRQYFVGRKMGEMFP